LTCTDIQAALPGYIDGELDPLRNLEIEQHLQHCAACSKAYKADQTLQTAIRTGAPYYPAPADLRKRIRSSIGQERKGAPVFPAMPWRWLSLAASVAVVVILAWNVVPRPSGLDAEQLMAQEVVASHVRSLMASHLVDVSSSDRHVVKPWFTGKLDFSPSVVDLTDHGFPLIGGRLDYLDKRPVAAVVYKRREHVINLFIRPAGHDSPVAHKPVTPQGYHLFSWTQSGMTYVAISDLTTNEMQEFVRLVQAPT
jgi:mycothiol system anti-sigma-R factor